MLNYWLTRKYNIMLGSWVGEGRRTHSLVPAANLVHPLPAMDITPDKNSKSQSKRINRCDLIGFQCLADGFEPSLCCNMYKHRSLHLIVEWRENQFLPQTTCTSAVHYVLRKLSRFFKVSTLEYKHMSLHIHSKADRPLELSVFSQKYCLLEISWSRDNY